MKVGPKDLQIEVRALPLARYAYFRTAFCGVITAGYKHVGVKRTYVRVARWNPLESRLVMRAAWV